VLAAHGSAESLSSLRLWAKRATFPKVHLLPKDRQRPSHYLVNVWGLISA
jgi:hypothetical protein